jgi:hypothetical protein
MNNRTTGFVVAAACALAWSVGLVAASVPAYVIAKEGDAVGISTVSTLNAPFTDGNGRVGFVGSLADNQRFVWWNTGPVFYSNDALPDVLTGSEGTMGVTNAGGFIYSPSVNGNDAVYTHGGVLQQRGDALPGLPGLYSSFNSRPTMLPNGTAYWITGSTPTQGSTTSTNRHLYKATDAANPATRVRVLGGGDVIEGKAIATTASNFDYWISDNDAHHIHILDMNTGSSLNNLHMYVDGGFVAQEGQPTGDGDNWSGFDAPSVNDAGNYVFAGDTSGPTASDAFLAYDAIIRIREGDTIDGVTLASGAAVRAASIANDEKVAFIWGWGTGGTLQEHLFLGDGANLAAAVKLLSINDEIDVNGDTIGDFRITDFNASGVIGPGLDFAGGSRVYVDVDMIPVGGGTEIQAIISVPEPAALALLAVGLIARRRT